jgi:hypothetical protein
MRLPGRCELMREEYTFPRSSFRKSSASSIEPLKFKLGTPRAGYY